MNPLESIMRFFSFGRSISKTLPDAQRRITALQKIPRPFSVQNMMRQKQDKHPDSQPFMGRLPHKFIGHHQQQCNRHPHVYTYFYHHLRLHSDRLLRFLITMFSQASYGLSFYPQFKSVYPVHNIAFCIRHTVSRYGKPVRNNVCVWLQF